MSETRPPLFASGQGLSHSFSMASLAEGSSEPISEAEEINEVCSGMNNIVTVAILVMIGIYQIIQIRLLFHIRT